MHLAPGEVVVVVDELQFPASDQVHYLPDGPLAAGIRVSTGEFHEPVVVVAEG